MVLEECGKSFLIHALKSLIHQIWPSSDLSCAIAAPTGLAAFNVGGMTIHRLFHLPIEHEGRQAGYWSLSKDPQKVMKSILRSLKLVIVDEISMVLSLNLAYMHLRLEELLGGHRQFPENPFAKNWAVQLLLTYGKNPWSMMS